MLSNMCAITGTRQAFPHGSNYGSCGVNHFRHQEELQCQSFSTLRGAAVPVISNIKTSSAELWPDAKLHFSSAVLKICTAESMEVLSELLVKAKYREVANNLLS